MEPDAFKPVQLSGVDVCFPHQPYGVQKVFMAQVVRAIDHEENALLEAPTGCGKTLSLLCGALAWQTAAKAKRAAAEQQAAEKAAAAAKPGVEFDVIEDSQQEPPDGGPGKAAAAASSSGAAAPPEEPVVVPKIYYATRTHSQIAQVVRELKRTVYKPKMAVLGARPHYCINQAVIRKGNIDAECEELLKDGMGCKYKKNSNSIGHGIVKVHDIEDLARIGKRNTACPYFVARHLADSAELIFCPYSYLLDPNIRRSTRINAADAILIFDEAHNIEDQAREAGTMEVELDMLKGSVMALLVAANTSAEGETYRQLSDAVLQLINWILTLADGNSAGAPGQGFKQAGFESFERIWTGQQMLSALSEAGLGPQEVEHLWACYEKAKAAEEKAGFATEGDAALEPVPAEVKTPRAGGNALGCVSSLLSVLRLMYGTYTEAPSVPPAGAEPGAAAAGAAGSAAAGAAAGGAGGSGSKVVQSVPGVDHVTDYRLAVQMWLPRDTNHNNNRNRRDRRRPESSTDGFAETTGCAATTSWAFRFCLWCLNPAVIFRSLSAVARSVLLTSGTLSPLDSFSGELGLDFHVKLEAPHVVDVHKQVFSRVVGQGLEGRKLRATFKEADQLEYQDSLGQLLLAVASTVPDGLLLFLPSYALMDKLSKRWQDTGLMAQLQRVKAVFSEPRRAGDDFDATIKRYYESIDEGQGGLFMAVCRGKVSEGIDFADGRARCVMVVGIPYPHAKDSKVALKKDYNNATATASARAGGRQGPYVGGGSSASNGNGPPRLLTGDAWYSQQAFRALNQAIGRCIRHRLDYGAILLVDERFKEPRNQTSLSKWVRGAIRPAASTQALLQDLGGFFQGLAANPPGAAAAAAAAAAGPLPAGAQSVKQQGQLVKPGFEAGPGLGCAGPGMSCKPGFEAAPGGLGGCAGGGFEQSCCGAAGAQKPGFEPFAAGSGAAGAGGPAAAGGAGGDPRSRWQQPQLPPAGKQPWQPQQKPPPAPQQPPKAQQQQQGSGRMMGPMDAFLVKAAAKQRQQQQQQGGAVIKQESPQPGPGPVQQQQQGGQPVMVKQEGAHAMWPPADMRQGQQPPPPPQQQQFHTPAQGRQQQQQQQRPAQGQAVSCLTALHGTPQHQPHSTPGAQQQMWQQQQRQQQPGPQQPPWQQQQPQQQQQQQHEVLKPLDCNAPSMSVGLSSAVLHTSCDGTSKQRTSTSPGAAADPAVVSADAPQTGSTAATAATPQPQPAEHMAGADASAPGAAAAAAPGTVTAAAAERPGPGQMCADMAGPAAAAEGGAGSGPLQCPASGLGLSLQQVQQWVAGDMGSMVQHLRQQQQAGFAAADMQLQELACFGIMASFDKALELCQQQQQPGSDAAGGLAGFWQQWHSYVPMGLLVAAAAAGHASPEHVVGQGDRGQWQGPWMHSMQQQGLQHTLTTMAGLYDQVLEQQQRQQEWQLPSAGGMVQQAQGRQDSHSCNAPPGFQQQQQRAWPQQQQQQQRWQPEQLNQSGWPPPAAGQGMPGPNSSSRPQRTLPASLQPHNPLQQHQQHLGNTPGSTHLPAQGDTMRFAGRAGLGLGLGKAAAAPPGAAAGVGGGPAAAGTGAGGQRAQLKLQLSQSAQQPKRAAVMSAKAQLAAQKRSKAATGQAVLVRPPPAAGAAGPAAAADSDDDEDDFR